MNRYDVVIIGGGAAGLAAAVSYSVNSSRPRVLVIEKEKKVGRRLLATGSGRCNLTNLDMSPFYYNENSRPFVEKVISKMPPSELMRYFEKLGLRCRPDSAGRVYPYSNQAASVLDTLLLWCGKKGVEILTETKVERITSGGRGYIVKTNNGEFHADKLILASGGAVQKNLGADGSSYTLAGDMGIAVTSTFPSLAPIPVSDKRLSSVKGVRTAAVVSVAADGKILHTEEGELQFNEKNISGICVFQLSRYVGEYFSKKGRYKNIEIFADIAPDMTEGDLSAYFSIKRKTMPDQPADSLFTGLLNAKLGRYILQRCGDKPNVDKFTGKFIGKFTDKEFAVIIHKMKRLSFVPSSMMGVDSAQVTAGGVKLSEIKDNFESVKYKGLYIVGEALDVDGMCGGYNLHFAFSSGIMAGQNAAKSR